MENLRTRVMNRIGSANEFGSDEELRLCVLEMFLDELKRDSPIKERGDKAKSLLSWFSGFFMACIAVMRSGQQLDRIGEMEKIFKANGKDVQVQFLQKVLTPFCMQTSRNAIEIASHFLYASDDEVVSCAKDVLEKTGQSDSGKKVVSEVLQAYVPGSTCALSILANVDADMAMSLAMGILAHADERIRHEALCVLARGPLGNDVSSQVVRYLKSKGSKKLWSDDDHRKEVYRFIGHLSAKEILSAEEADDIRELIKKSFSYEDGNNGLCKLLPIAELIEVGGKELIFDGFVAMEDGKNKPFGWRKESVEKFIKSLDKERAVKYLQKTLVISVADGFAWFAGQYLIAYDIDAATNTFVGVAKTKDVSLKKVGTLAQLAMKVCNDDGHEKWGLDELNNSIKARFAPVANALLAYAESDECPVEIRLMIAFQPTMFGGNNECCLRAIIILDKVISGLGISCDQMQMALRALFNCKMNKADAYAKTVDFVLEKAYASDNKKLLLDQAVEIMTKDIRGYPMTTLTYPAVCLLENAEPNDAIPILKKALHAKLPNGDHGMGSRGLYISALKKFALKGRADVVSIMAEYHGGNIDSNQIPKTLVEVYQETSSAIIKKIVVRCVAERFLFSISKASDNNVFYFYEMDAVEALKEESLIQEAFLKGIEAIGDSGHHRSSGMCKIIEKIPVIIPEENRGADVLSALNRLLEKLALEKKKHVDEARWSRDDEFIRAIDLISAEAGMALASA